MSEQVSINLCCYNGAAFLRETLESICAQTFSDWELVIINDGSTDGSADIIRGYIDDGWPIRYTYQENTGLGAARNAALAASKGAFIAFIDQDDLWHPEKLTRQMPLFDDPQVGIVFCDVIKFNEAGQKKRQYRHQAYATGRCFEALFSRYFLSLPAVVIRRAAVDGLTHPFDPRFKMIEEADLFTRIAYSWKLAMVDAPLALWRVHAASFTHSAQNALGAEYDMLLDSYDAVIPGFRENYGATIATLQRRVHMDQAVIHLRRSDPRAARRCVRGHCFTSPKAFLLTLLTLFPVSVVKKMYRIKGKWTLSSPTDA